MFFKTALYILAEAQGSQRGTITEQDIQQLPESLGNLAYTLNSVLKANSAVFLSLRGAPNQLRDKFHDDAFSLRKQGDRHAAAGRPLAMTGKGYPSFIATRFKKSI